MLLIILQNNCDGFWSWSWAYPIICAFLLGLVLGWLLKSLFGNNDHTNCEKCEGLEDELRACRANAKILTSTNTANLTSSIAATPKKKTATKKKATPKKVTAVKTESTAKDDLTKVEGIGKKIQEHFNNDGIWTWEQLSNSSIDRLQKILDDAGPRYRIHNPGTWSKQANMAFKGEWEKLKKWQDEHKGGRA